MVWVVLGWSGHEPPYIVRVCGSLEEAERYMRNPPRPGYYDIQGWGVAHKESDDSQCTEAIEP